MNDELKTDSTAAPFRACLNGWGIWLGGLWFGAWFFLATAVRAQELPAETAGTDGPIRTMLDFLGGMFDVSAASVFERLKRIGAILVIVAIAAIVMAAVRRISVFVVYSNWGPLKYVFRNHQRSITLHRLAINLIKYVVYFTALGHILNALGVNYMTFLASLSLVGIAIGFGSQGLVQDVVTGFFILFEGQFSVGDMVEISGQSGIVTEIGLRTTRIRNYLGAEIILQNRNIPMAARYRRGAMDGMIDVALEKEEDLGKAEMLLETVGEEFARQFEEVILDRPSIEDPVRLETGELFARLYVKLWPAQQWLVDQQMIPRIKEIFEKNEIAIPAGRVVAFYHRPEQPERLRRARRYVRSGEAAG